MEQRAISASGVLIENIEKERHYNKEHGADYRGELFGEEHFYSLNVRGAALNNVSGLIFHEP